MSRLTIPRSWFYEVSNADIATPSITLPALPGVSHVITDVEATIWQGATAQASQVGVTIAEGASTKVVVLLVSMPAAIFTKDSDSESAPALWIGTLGAAVTIACNTSPGAFNGSLLKIHGMDIG